MHNSSPESTMEYWYKSSNEEQLRKNQRSELNIDIGSGTIEQQGCIILFLIASILLLMWQGTKIFEWYQLEQHAHLTEAVVWKVEERVDDDNDLTGYDVHYSYHVSKEQQQGSVKVSIAEGRTISPQQAIRVLYDEQAPQHSLVLPHDSVWSYVPYLQENSIVLTVMLLLFLRLRGKRARARLLLESGTLVDATVKSASIEHDSEGPDRLKLVVEYEALNGKVSEVTRLLELPPELPARGSLVRLLLHPQLKEVGLL